MDKCLDNYTKTKESSSFNMSIDFGFKNFDYIVLFISLIIGIAIICTGILFIILTIITILDAYNLQKSLSAVEIVPLLIGTCFGLILGTYIIKCLLKIFQCNCKSLYMDTNNKQLIINIKKSSLQNLPFKEIESIDIKRQGLIGWVTFDFVKIYTSRREIYTLATSDAIDLYKKLPDGIKKRIL